MNALGEAVLTAGNGALAFLAWTIFWATLAGVGGIIAIVFVRRYWDE